MSTTPQFPLSIVRPLAEQLLAELAADRGDYIDAYWVGRLSTALQSMVDATAPADTASSPDVCLQRGPGDRYRCTLDAGHHGHHEAHGTSPLATWLDGDTEFTYEPEGDQS